MESLIAIAAVSCCVGVPAVIAVAWLRGMRKKDTGDTGPKDQAAKDVARREGG